MIAGAAPAARSLRGFRRQPDRGGAALFAAQRAGVPGGGAQRPASKSRRLAVPQCCISDGVASVMRDAGATQVMVAASPDENALFESAGPCFAARIALRGSGGPPRDLPNPAGSGPLQTRNAVMVDDRPEDTNRRRNRAGRSAPARPSIWKPPRYPASARNTAAGAQPEPAAAAASGERRCSSAIIAALCRRLRRRAGARAWPGSSGWPNAASPLPAPPADTAAIDDLAARVASVESKANAPSPPPAPCPIRRLPRASMRWRNLSPRCAANSPALRAQSEKLAALVNDMKSAPHDHPPPSPDLSADQRTHRAARAHHARAGRPRSPRRSCENASRRCAASPRRRRIPARHFGSGTAIPISQHWRRRNLSRRMPMR